MATDWDLEDWLLTAGEGAERKRISNGYESLSPTERLVREVWVFDMETRNGGVSQYFCNHGLAQWQALRDAWLVDEVPSLEPIITEVERVIGGAADPYLATLGASPGIEAFYEAHQPSVLAKLRSLKAADE